MRHRYLICISFLIISLTFCRSKQSAQPISKSQNNYDNNADLRIASSFALNFQPDPLPYQDIGKLGKVPDSVVMAFKRLRTTNNEAHNKWLALIFLKLYLDHLRCCHQGYELRTNTVNGVDSIADPLIYEFLLATKLADVSKPIEFVNSGIADLWVKENPLALNDSEIKNVLAQLKPVQDSISKGLYW